MKIPIKLVYQYMVIFFIFSLTSNHFHSLQVENCDSNSRLVVDEDDYGKLRLERVKRDDYTFFGDAQFTILAVVKSISLAVNKLTIATPWLTTGRSW